MLLDGAMTGEDSEVRNFFTLDIEEWYRVNYGGIDLAKCRELPSNLEATVDRLIELCEMNNVKTTCFVLGQLAEENPGVVRKLHRAGHEIASHGYGHQMITQMKPEEFRQDLTRSSKILENIIGEKVIGYRAPSYSVTKENLEWFYSTLEELGFRYSSSVFPAKAFLYGIKDFPQQMHLPVINGRRCSVMEIPVPVVSIIGKKIGLYIRLFPSRFIIAFIERRNRRGQSVFLYLHPREIDVRQPKLSLPFWTSLIHYWGIRGCEKRVADILRVCGPGFFRMRDILPPQCKA
ncbi:MAG: polysaccharide deacetylase family protein [Dissulfurispiraceae bacterium]|jgi:polysaccharide deacetylase family protein (PEP-CTERM system associated)